MRRHIWIWLFVFIGLPLVMVSFYLIHWFDAFREYNRTFTPLAEAAVPKLAELNDQVLSDLLPPPGVELIRQSSVEPWSPIGTRMYYVYSYADYNILEANPDEIVAYYQDLFEQQGWQGQVQSGNHYAHSRGSAYMRFEYYYSEYMQKYTLSVSHDFWSQEFSPPRPSAEIAAVWCYLQSYICNPPK